MAEERSALLPQVMQYLTPSVQVFLLAVVVIALRRFWKKKVVDEDEDVSEPPLEPMPKRDFTPSELREFNGKVNQRILIAVNGKVFDVTKARGLYGPEGPYNVFAGRDASRGLATFSIDVSSMRDDYDDLSDLNSMQMESVAEWEMQFMEKYDLIGKLIRDGEEHTNYKADESEDERESRKPPQDKKTD